MRDSEAQRLALRADLIQLAPLPHCLTTARGERRRAGGHLVSRAARPIPSRRHIGLPIATYVKCPSDILIGFPPVFRMVAVVKVLAV